MKQVDPSTVPAVDVAIALNAVLAVVKDEQPKVLCILRDDGSHALPYGPFDPALHRTLEGGIRDWVTKQTQISLGFIEQLYTFGDRGREAPAAALDGSKADDRIVSVGYLALAPEPADMDQKEAQWLDWYRFFPWEDWRSGPPAILDDVILTRLDQWANEADTKERAARRAARINLAFGHDAYGWEEERILDRYELMFEAGLLEESHRNRNAPQENASIAHSLAMHSDHRRILATAISRLRGKLKYRPIIFEMMGPAFTLLQLQKTVEAIVGFGLHKQNFRRSVEKSGFIEPTNKTVHQPSGRPAALFTADKAGIRAAAANGLTIPRLKRQ